MIKIKRRCFSMLLAFSVALILNLQIVSAQEIQLQLQPQIIFENPDLNVPNDVIQELIEENPSAGQIIISEYKNINNEKSIVAIQQYNEPVLKLLVGDYYSNVNKTTTSYGVYVKDSFVTSVARGQTQTLSSSWSSTLSCEISGDISSASLGITKSITKSYSKSDTFSGPPENSYYNCREFRVKFYENRGTYTAVLNSRFPGTSIYIKINESGTWSEPTYYLAYSVDKNI